ncbi:hypothetical protein LSAT2_030348 [Lamellibrachia satsuma]|nr:hypothetical protein LSAT2_030348 [Lamellibrachia satsuma]
MAQFKDTLVVELDENTVYEMKGRPCELSAYSFIPPRRTAPKAKTYFNVDRQDRYMDNTYNRLYQQDYGFNNKLHRCDREHAKSRGLKVIKEEESKAVPTLSSSVYGHRLGRPLETRDMKHARVAAVQEEFYRTNTNQVPVI